MTRPGVCPAPAAPSLSAAPRTWRKQKRTVRVGLGWVVAATQPMLFVEPTPLHGCAMCLGHRVRARPGMARGCARIPGADGLLTCRTRSGSPLLSRMRSVRLSLASTAAAASERRWNVGAGTLQLGQGHEAKTARSASRRTVCVCVWFSLSVSLCLSLSLSVSLSLSLSLSVSLAVCVAHTHREV